MISGQQDVRHFPSSEFRRPRVVRAFQQPAAETVVRGRLFVAEDTRQQTNNRIDENHRGNRAIRQHIIADRNLRIDQMLDHAVIDSFVMPADDDQMRLARKIRSPCSE